MESIIKSNTSFANTSFLFGLCTSTREACAMCCVGQPCSQQHAAVRKSPRNRAEVAQEPPAWLAQRVRKIGRVSPPRSLQKMNRTLYEQPTTRNGTARTKTVTTLAASAGAVATAHTCSRSGGSAPTAATQQIQLAGGGLSVALTLRHTTRSSSRNQYRMGTWQVPCNVMSLRAPLLAESR